MEIEDCLLNIMITDKKTSGSSSCLHASHKSTLEIFPMIHGGIKKGEGSYEKLQISASFLNSNSRFLTPITSNKSYIYSQTMQDMKSKDSIMKILKVNKPKTRKLHSKKLELIGKTVVTAQKSIPKIKPEALPLQLSSEYLKKLANVKSKYFSYIQCDIKTYPKPIKRLKQLSQTKQINPETLRKKINEAEEPNIETFDESKSISLAGWEQDS